MSRNVFISKGGGGKLVYIGWNQIYAEKGNKCSEKCLNIFVMRKHSDWDEHFSEHFFQSWNEIANTQKIAGWYKVYI
jgi:hypothetical protein